MAYHDELMAHAIDLIRLSPPTEMHLRRAVSAAYYAVKSSTSPMKIVIWRLAKYPESCTAYGVNLLEGSWYDLGIHRRKRRKAPPDAL
jgi:hypothetical protein